MPQEYSCLKCAFKTKRRDIILNHLSMHRLSAEDTGFRQKSAVTESKNTSPHPIKINVAQNNSTNQIHWVSAGGDVIRKRQAELKLLSLKTGKSVNDLVMEQLRGTGNQSFTKHAILVSEGKISTDSSKSPSNVNSKTMQNSVRCLKMKRLLYLSIGFAKLHLDF